MMSKEKQFFEMPAEDKITLIVIIVYAVVAFFFIKSDITIAGMAVIGWIMGLFMFVAPAVSIFFTSMHYARREEQKKLNL